MSALFQDKLELGEFPASLLADWRAAAEATLKGKPLESLKSKTGDGLTVEPVYTVENSAVLSGGEADPGRAAGDQDGAGGGAHGGYLRGCHGWTIKLGGDSPLYPFGATPMPGCPAPSRPG